MIKASKWRGYMCDYKCLSFKFQIPVWTAFEHWGFKTRWKKVCAHFLYVKRIELEIQSRSASTKTIPWSKPDCRWNGVSIPTKISMLVWIRLFKTWDRRKTSRQREMTQLHKNTNNISYILSELSTSKSSSRKFLTKFTKWFHIFCHWKTDFGKRIG